jgi:hypothetical protein
MRHSTPRSTMPGGYISYRTNVSSKSIQGRFYAIVFCPMKFGLDLFLYRACLAVLLQPFSHRKATIHTPLFSAENQEKRDVSPRRC